MLKRAVVALVLVACGGAPIVSQECTDYLSCSEKTNTSTQAMKDIYGESGTCWADHTTADSCTASCKSALKTLKNANPDAGC